MVPTIVSTGVDTLKVNVKLLGEEGTPMKVQEVSSRLVELLQVWQEQARASCKPVKTSMTFHEARMMMLPNGAQAWKYIVKNDCLQVAIAPRLQVPMVAKVTFFSPYLWAARSISEAVDEAHSFLIDLFGPDLFLQAAQLDLCVDVMGWNPPQQETQQHFLSRATGKHEIEASHKDRAYYRGRTLETLNFSGHGSPVSCKLYNKVAEIKQRSKDKVWFYDLWKQNGWDGTSQVWRVEFSIEREGLHEMKIEDLYDALRNIKRIWAYCTQEWLRMVIPATTRNRTRWATAPTWAMIQRAFDGYGDAFLDVLGPLVRQRVREANIEQGIAAIAGYITTLAAWHNDVLPQDADTEHLFLLVQQEVQERWNRLQLSPQDLVQAKKFIYHQIA